MPYNDFEMSVEDSSPVELYEFSYQGGTLRFTSADRDVIFASNLYRFAQLSRTKIDESGDIAKAHLTITAPPDFEVAELFGVAPPDDVVGLVLRRLQPEANAAPAIWLGRVLSARWPKNQSELRCESVFTQMKIPGLRRIYSKNCPHVLYGPRCKVSEIAFAEEITLDVQTGRTLVSSGFDVFPDGYFSGGKISWESSPGYFVKRGIKTHVGDTVTISHPMAGIAPGTVFTALPGCNHTLSHCGPKFDNVPNHGGMPYMKTRNPFNASSSVFS